MESIKLNKLYIDDIEFHTNIIQYHKDKIEQINTQYLKELEELLSENIKQTSQFSNILNRTPVEKDALFNMHIKNADHVEDNGAWNDTYFPDETIDAQDLILARMQEARIKSEGLDNVIETPMKSNSCRMNIAEKENNLLEDQLLPELKTQSPKQTEIKPPLINALFRINPKQRQTVVKNIFKEAQENIESLCKINDSLRKDFDKMVQSEADRLLDVYLKTH